MFREVIEKMWEIIEITNSGYKSSEILELKRENLENSSLLIT